MSSLFSWFFPKKHQVEKKQELWSELFSVEGNTLILINNNKSQFFMENLKNVLVNGIVFDKNVQSPTEYHKEWNLEYLDSVILHQKKMIDEEESIESISPFVVVFNNCLDDNYSINYLETIEKATKLKLRTVTITKNLSSMPDHLDKYFDSVLLFGKLKNFNSCSQIKYIWYKFVKKMGVTFEDFQQKVSLTYKKGLFIKSNSSISNLKMSFAKKILL